MPRAPIAGVSHRRIASVSVNGNGGEEERERGHSDYFGCVYHIGTNKTGHNYCHLRFMFIRGKYVEMYKRDPHENPGIRPIRRGVVGPSLMIEELGRRRVNHGDVYVIRFYDQLDQAKKGEIACATAGEVPKWMEAFDHAKQQAESELLRGGSARNKLNMETEFRDTAATIFESGWEFHFESGWEAHEWKCVRKINELANMVVFVGEPGDIDYEGLLSVLHKSVIQKGFCNTNDQLHGNRSYPLSNVSPSDSPNVVQTSKDCSSSDIRDALGQLGCIKD